VGNPKTVLKGGYVGWKGESSFANFGFERLLVGLANLLQCGWGFFLFCGREEKKQIKFHQICTVLSKN
jgi:hypothetical protein